MKDFRSVFKALAQSKQLTRHHVIQNCVLRALAVQGKTLEEKVSIADWYVRQAFTPITRKVKLDNGREPYDTVYWALFYGKLDINQFFDTDGEEVEYSAILQGLIKRYSKPKDYYGRCYFYVFVRQDISPEYQAVQACHAAAKMGHREGASQFSEKSFDQLYITLVGVPDVNGLVTAIADISALGLEAYMFHEPDLNGELTAVASSPIPASERKRLLSYKRLKF